MSFASQRILVTGGAGFLGSHVVAELKRRGVPESQITVPRSRDADLRDAAVCQRVTAGQQLVIHLAGNVGGIGYNKDRPAELLDDNLLMGMHLLRAAREQGVRKFVLTGTVCSYPKFAQVPFREDALDQGFPVPGREHEPPSNRPEETNAPYGLAKKMLFEQARAYRRQYGFNTVCLLPVNLYGPGDHFDVERSHVIPALIRKVADAQASGVSHIDVWGTGHASREFLYVEDAADAIVLAAERYDDALPVNIGSGREITIRELVVMVCDLMGFFGEIRWSGVLDGQPRRGLDVSRARERFGFVAGTSFEEGLSKTIAWFRTAAPA